MKTIKLSLMVLLITAFAAVSAFAQGNGQGKDKKQQKQEQKQTNKEAKKLGNKAEEAAEGIGRDAVFCVLAAHTDIEDFQSAQALKDKFESLTDFPFGQFVAAVQLVDRLDKEGFGLNEVIAFLVEDGLSIGEITRLADVNMGEVRRGFGQMRSELARSMTNPPTKNCFETNP
jgi:hypothetical protein